MTCAIVRQRLLASERPDRPAEEDSYHLAACPACHSWLQHLTRIERQLPQLKVPSSMPPQALFRRILTEPVGGSAPPLVVRPAMPYRDQRRIREGGRQKLALASSLAATLALFTFAWWAWPPPPSSPVVPRAVARVYPKDLDKRLKPARTPAERIDVFAAWARDQLDKVRERGDDPEAIAQLAGEFDRIVLTDLMLEALKLSPGERDRVLTPVADLFARTESDASRLAASWTTRHTDSATHVRRIAVSAKEADTRLRRLVHRA